MHMPAMANGYEADDARLAVDGVDDPKAADTVADIARAQGGAPCA
jgi:hypothetical protein